MEPAVLETAPKKNAYAPYSVCIDPVHIHSVPGCLWPACLLLMGKAGLGLTLG